MIAYFLDGAVSGALDVWATPTGVKEPLLLHPALKELLVDGGLLTLLAVKHLADAPLKDVRKVLLELINEHLLEWADDDDRSREVVLQLLHLNVRRRDWVLGRTALHQATCTLALALSVGAGEVRRWAHWSEIRVAGNLFWSGVPWTGAEVNSPGKCTKSTASA